MKYCDACGRGTKIRPDDDQSLSTRLHKKIAAANAAIGDARKAGLRVTTKHGPQGGLPAFSVEVLRRIPMRE